MTNPPDVPQVLEPDRPLEWETKALELDSLHVELNHAEYRLKQIAKAKSITEVRRILKGAL